IETCGHEHADAEPGGVLVIRETHHRGEFVLAAGNDEVAAVAEGLTLEGALQALGVRGDIAVALENGTLADDVNDSAGKQYENSQQHEDRMKSDHKGEGPVWRESYREHKVDSIGIQSVCGPASFILRTEDSYGDCRTDRTTHQGRDARPRRTQAHHAAHGEIRTEEQRDRQARATGRKRDAR